MKGKNMNKSVEEYRDEIKKILDEYYELLRIHNKFLIQVFENYKLPDGMFTGEIEVDTEYNLKFKTWKMIPSDVTEEDISKLEKEIGIRLPAPLRAYYTSYYHLWDWQINLSGNSPKAKMIGIYEAYNTLMIHFGYLPFSWDNQYGCLFCMKFDENNNECGIYSIDHEEMFGFEPETATLQDIEKVMRFEAENFCEYLYNETVGTIMKGKT